MRRTSPGAVCALLALSVFGLMVVAVFGTAPEGTFVRHAEDGTSWTLPAQGLVLHGDFVDPENPETTMNYRPPAYPALVALGMVTGGADYADLVVAFQILLLVATAFLTWKICDLAAPGSGTGAFAFALLLLNPNSLGTAFFVQSETLSAFFVAILVWGLFAFAAAGRPWMAAVAGMAAALAALTRPEARFLIVIVPVAILLLDLLRPGRPDWRRVAGATLLCFAVSAAIAAPWMTRNYLEGDGFRLTASGNTEYYVWGSATQIEMEETGLSEREAEQRVQEARAAYIAAQGERWETLSPEARDKELVAAGLRHIFDYSGQAIARNVVKATLQFFTAGGSGRIFALVGKPDASPFAVMVREGLDDHVAAVRSALSQADPGLLLIWIVSFGYVVVTRVAGLIGLYVMMRRGQWGGLLIVVSGILFYALVIPFYGIARFRVSVECLFVLLAVIGGAAVLSWWRSRIQRKATG